MKLQQQINTIEYFSSVRDIPNPIWEQLGCTTNTYFNPKYLIAIEQNHVEIQFCYVVLYDTNQLPIAFAIVQIVDLYLTNIHNNYTSWVARIKDIGNKYGVFYTKKPLKILICGNSFLSGEHGIFIKANQDKNQVLQNIIDAISRFVVSDDILKRTIKGFLLKDFITEALTVNDDLLKKDFHSFKVDPNMLMSIDTNWINFTDYLGAMKTKFRVKAKKALELSSGLQEIDITRDNLEYYTPQMTVLYRNVSTKAGFKLGEFNINSYLLLKDNLADTFIIKGYLHDGELVGFLTGMINNNHLDAHFVGIDYRYNRMLAIYQRMLYDYIKIAIEQRLSYINFGRTASEIKSSVGATPQELTIFLRHRNSIPNKIIRLFLNRIQSKPFNQKHPFKAKSFVKQA